MIKLQQGWMTRRAGCLALGLGSLGWVANPAIAQTTATVSSYSTIFENITVAPQFSPESARMHGFSGGAVAAGELAGRAATATGPCTGFIDQEPDHRLTLTQFFNFLSLEIQSSEDTSLVIRGPGGIWCNDDYSNKNPGIAGQWLSGTYDIWIGAPRQNDFAPYVIRLSEQKP
jgi:hypothetical protein